MLFLSGLVNVLVTTPLWVVNSRLKVQGARIRDSQHTKHQYNGILGMMLNSIGHHQFEVWLIRYGRNIFSLHPVHLMFQMACTRSTRRKGCQNYGVGQFPPWFW